jgi:MoxR-like ATPase
LRHAEIRHVRLYRELEVTHNMPSLSGIYEVGQGTTKELYKHTIQNGTNMVVFGPAGGGKTEMAIQAVKETGLKHIYVDLSVLEAPDFIGLPTIGQSRAGGKFVEYAAPEFMPCKDMQADEAEPVVMIFDELDKSKPELQNPLLEVFQFRSVNGRELNVKAILATGNLPDEGAFSQPVSHALTNRCSCYKMVLDFDSWQAWAVTAGINPLVVGFLSRNPEQLLMAPPEGDPTAYCHASPRAWTLAARDLDAASTKEVEFQTMLVSGRVGTGAAANFRVWLDHYRHIEPYVDKLVKDGKAPPEMSIDKLIVCAISATGAIAKETRSQKGGSKKKDQEKVHKITGHVMKWLSKTPSEIQIAAVKNSLDMDLIRDYNLTKAPGFMDVINKTRNVLKGE